MSTQIGLTGAFDGTKSTCQDTIINLKGRSGTKKVFDFLDSAAKGDVAGLVESWTDGYTLKMTMTMGQ